MNIVINCGVSGPNRYWDGRDLATGLGGSESQAVGWAEVLAKRGHNVSIVNNCWPMQHINGVTYLPFPLVNWAECSTDIHIAWRNYELLKTRIAPIQILSCHDIPVSTHCPAEWSDDLNIDAVWLLNDYHARIYTAIPEANKWICKTGIDTSWFQRTMERTPGKCIYFSHPDRGLDDLHHVWSDIRAKVPYATLHAFWWEPEHFRPAQESLGIMPMRSLGEEALADELLTSDIFSYPCTFSPEISPVTTIKAQLAGAIPVYIERGGMVDTIQYGHRVDQLSNFADAVAHNIHTVKWDENRRALMRNRALRTYDWDVVADVFEAKWCS